MMLEAIEALVVNSVLAELEKKRDLRLHRHAAAKKKSLHGGMPLLPALDPHNRQAQGAPTDSKQTEITVADLDRHGSQLCRAQCHISDHARLFLL